MIKLIVAGEKGRMGHLIKEMALQDNRHRFKPVLGFDKDEDPSIMKQGNVIIDFTIPIATIEHVKVARASGIAMVIGTTGLNRSDMDEIRRAAKSIPIVQSANMSMGMNVLFKTAQSVAKYFQPKNIEISERHHIHKADAPSGSALALKDFMRRPDSHWEGDIPIKSIREGEVVGDHTVLQTGWDEEIELTHRARSRVPFAAGALEAAVWVIGKKPGLYTMQDVLNL